MKIKIEFSESAIRELVEWEKKIEHPKLLLRINVMQMVACGIPNHIIQKVKGISHDSLWRFRRAYRKWWVVWLLDWKCSGRSGKLTIEQKKEIKEIGEREWFKTAKYAKKMIKEKYGIEYKIRQVEKLLKKRNLATKRQKKYLEIVQA